MNANLKRLDSVVQLQVIDKDLATPPGSPATGERYIVGASPTGAWSGHAKDIAVYLGSWVFYTPKDGWVAWVTDENMIYVYDGGAWTSYKPGPATGVTKKLALSAAEFTGTKVERGTVDTGYAGVEFADGADDAIYATIQMPSDLGTTWSALRLLFTNEGTSTNNVRWEVGTEKLTDGSAANSSFTTEAVGLVIAPPSSADQLKIASFGSPPNIAGRYAAGDMVKTMVKRKPTDGADTNAGTMVFLGLIFEYTNV